MDDRKERGSKNTEAPQPVQHSHTINVQPGGVAIVIEIHGKATITVTHAEPPRTARKRETKTKTRTR
jgi:hypothetical protein